MWHVALLSWHWIRQVAAPCNVARGSGMTWHWIRQVAAPCNVARGSEIRHLNSPGGSTLQCDTWLLDHDIEFARWQHPAIWHVAPGSCHWIREVAAPVMWHVALRWHAIELAQNVRHIGILLPVSISTISPQTTCHSAQVCEILSKSDGPRLKNYAMSIFKMAKIGF